MTSCHVFIGTSLDGFIARENGETDWLENWPDVGHDYGYSEFMASVDGLIIGRGTFEKALSFGHWPYDKPVIVLSRSLSESDIRPDLIGKVRLSQSKPAHLLSELEREGWKRAYIDGGQVIQSFLREGLVHDMVLTRIPILLGSGLPLFGRASKRCKAHARKDDRLCFWLCQSLYEIQR